jgi:hypothetical protein
MKIKSLIGAAAAVLSAGVAAQAQSTYIEITGATAFRTAAVNAINNAFNSGGNAFTYGFANTTAASANASLTNGSMQIWKGIFPGIEGTTVVRTSWNGSVEGIRAVAVPNVDNNPLFLKESVLTGNLTVGGGTAATVRFHSDPAGSGAVVNAANYEQATSDLAFSDCAQSATPVSGLTLSGGPVGVVVFTMIASKSWSVDKLDISSNATIDYANRMPASVSAQQFRTMANLGYAPMSFFTGNASDTVRVYLTGRNDGSGTRTSYLSETGVGASTPITQYVAHDRSVGGSIPYILKVPAGGGFNYQNVSTSSYASTVWGNDIDGNGGHVSGSDLRSDLAKTTANTAVWQFVDGSVDGEPDGIYTSDEDKQTRAAEKLYLLTWITYSDALSARGNGTASTRTAEVLGYNGVTLPGLTGNSPSTTMSAADKALVANGQYTAWNFQQLYYINSTSGASTVFTELKSRLNSASVIGSAGMPLSEMAVNRTVDGGTILPGAPQ